MAKEVEVIFTEDKKGFFKIGQRKRVKLGYARNYLLPQGYAVLASALNEAALVSIETRANERLVELKTQAEETAPKLNGQTIEFEVKTHDEGRLYGSVQPQDVAEKINIQLEVQVDKFDLRMSNQIKEVGEYAVPIDIHSEVPIEITIVIKSENEDLSEAARKERERAFEAARSGESADSDEALEADEEEAAETVAETTEETEEVTAEA